MVILMDIILGIWIEPYKKTINVTRGDYKFTEMIGQKPSTALVWSAILYIALER